MSEYKYLVSMKTSEIIKIIEEMLDFEEVAGAINILEKRNSRKALELGSNIIRNDEGDEYLQAIVWDFLFFDYKEEMVENIRRRESALGRYLLDDIIVDLVDYQDELLITDDVKEKILSSFKAIDTEDRKKIKYNVQKFLDIYM